MDELWGQVIVTLVYEVAHELLRKSERRTMTAGNQRLACALKPKSVAATARA